MMIRSRRQVLTMTAAAAAGIAAPHGSRAVAQAGRSLHVEIQGFSLAIHIPEVIALREELPKLGYGAPKIDRIESMQVITQSIVAGSAEAGDADVVSTLRASEAGADIRLIGLVYNNTSQVLVANADKVKSYADFKNPSNAIALNSRGDFIYVMLSGILGRNGLDINDTTIVEIGGSGSRMRALLGGRVAAVPVHFDQAEAIIKQGNYQILIEPWKSFSAWYSEAWLVQGKWLEKPENQRAAVDLNKAMITAFRRTNEDYGYFAEGFRKYATVKDAAKTSDDELKPIWQKLSHDIKAWPNDGGFRRDDFRQLLPVYRQAGAIKAEPNVDRVIDTRYVEQALKELG
jgi:NitT/TauT family transport system substrate-binding protein